VQCHTRQQLKDPAAARSNIPPVIAKMKAGFVLITQRSFKIEQDFDDGPQECKTAIA
jgi:hypothetical protein